MTNRKKSKANDGGKYQTAAGKAETQTIQETHCVAILPRKFLSFKNKLPYNRFKKKKLAAGTESQHLVVKCFFYSKINKANKLIELISKRAQK